MKHFVMANTSGGFRGRISSPLKSGDAIKLFDTEAEARAEAKRLTDTRSPFGPALIWYSYGGVLKTEQF